MRNLSCGISNDHAIIGCQLKLESQGVKQKFYNYRRFKNFDADSESGS